MTTNIIEGETPEDKARRIAKIIAKIIAILPKETVLKELANRKKGIAH